MAHALEAPRDSGRRLLVLAAALAVGTTAVVYARDAQPITTTPAVSYPDQGAVQAATQSGTRLRSQVLQRLPLVGAPSSQFARPGSVGALTLPTLPPPQGNGPAPSTPAPQEEEPHPVPPPVPVAPSKPEPPSPAPPQPSHTLVDDLVNDVYGPPYRPDAPGKPWGANQAVLRGIPSNFDWADGAIGRTWDTANYKAVTPWGQIFEAGENGSPVQNVRVEIKSLEVFWLIDGKWQRTTPPSGSDGKVEGGYFSGTFSNAQNMPVDMTNGVSSFSLSPIHDLSHPVAHFWWSGWYPRPSVPAGATAMHISVWMRLVPGSPGVDVSQARYIAGVGIDEDRSATDVPDQAKGSLGMPRHKLLTSSWQRFGFTNLTEAQIRDNPPPVQDS